MSKHTEGKWTTTPQRIMAVNCVAEGHHLIEVRTQEGTIAYVSNLPPGKGDRTIDGAANARLMAAAPELLAACKFAEQWLHGEDKAILTAAIAKAEGAETVEPITLPVA